MRWSRRSSRIIIKGRRNAAFEVGVIPQSRLPTGFYRLFSDELKSRPLTPKPVLSETRVRLHFYKRSKSLFGFRASMLAKALIHAGFIMVPEEGVEPS